MSTAFTSTTLSGIYNDDWNENDNYHQMLFNSGRALQARELTQLQTMIYQEMGRMGRNVFKEGALVAGNGVAINTSYDYVQISTVTSGNFVNALPTDDPAGIVGITLTGVTSGVQAKIIEVYPVDSTFTEKTIYVQYINSGQSTSDSLAETPKTFTAGETLTGASTNLTVAASATSPASTPMGKGVRIDVGESDWFVMGRFVHFVGGSLVLSPYTLGSLTDSSEINANVGFKVTQEVVTVNDDNDLYDNSGDALNTSSPGADRYRIRLTLTTEANISASDTFVFVCRVENGQIVEQIEETDAYNKISDVLALRTEEESGDYIVNPFTLNFDSDTDTTLAVTVSEGLAYVRGYRVENPSPIELIVPRSQSTELVENDQIPTLFGNYVKVQDGVGNAEEFLPDLDQGTYTAFDLHDNVDLTGSAIGTARIRGIQKTGAGFNLYLFDVQMDADKSFKTVRSIGVTGGTAFYNFETDAVTNENAGLQVTTDNDLLMPTVRPRPESITDVTLVTQTSVDKTAANTNPGTLIMPTLTGETYTNAGDWIGVNLSNPGTVVKFDIGDVDISTPTAAVITNTVFLSNADNFRIVYYTTKTATVAQKAITETTFDASNAFKTLTTSTDPVSGKTIIDLKIVDVFEIEQLKDTDVNGVDISDRFILDDGQRDNFYVNAKLVLKDGATAPAGNVYAVVKHFSHGTGDFYAPESYSSVKYSEIPQHTRQDGTVINLRNYLDFRPDYYDGTFAQSLDAGSPGGSGNKFALPEPGTSINADVSYYLPRADKIIATQEGDIQILLGQQSKDPQLKATPDNSLELYQILMNANTADGEDVQIRPIEHKRYTMSDIAKLEAKLDDFTAYTELSLNELRAHHLPSVDSDGNERAESGVITDDLQDQTGSDTENNDYAAAIDPEKGLIRPKADEGNVRLIPTEVGAGTSNIIKKGDNAYISYTHEQWQYQDKASRSIKINPFGLVDNVGVIKLSPSSDEWKDSREDAVKALQGSSNLAQRQAFLWNNWQWNWKGRNDEDLWRNWDEERRSGSLRWGGDKEEYDRYNRGDNNDAPGFVRRVIRRASIRTRIGRRYIDLALIPWIRTRKIYFRAQGLKPGTKFTPFFDGKDVSDWCKQETFVAWSDRVAAEFGDGSERYTASSVTQHPDTPSSLVSDANGEVEGSFFIPNLRPQYYVTRFNKKRKIRQTYLRFRAGIREFKLLDINVNDWAQADSKAFAYYTVRGAMWHRWNRILTTRGYQTRWPLGLGFAGFPAAYNPKEMRNLLNQVTQSGVGLFKPQLAGQYGPNTSFLNTAALNTLDNNGQMSQVLSDYINVDNNSAAGNIVRPYSLPQNPLSQTFKVDNQFGLVLTKITLFFKTKDSGNLPVSVHLRPVIDGKPSTTDIVPDSHVFLNPSSVTAIGATSNPTLSTVQTNGTVFEFDEPVFLQPWTEYAIVVSSSSTEYEIFSAKTLESVLGSPSVQITTQPAPGTLFLPQNGVRWAEAKDQDIMMKIERAKFDVGGGTLVLKNAPLPASLLDPNPIKTTAGSSVVFVKHGCHGLMKDPVTPANGDAAQISGVTGTIGGIAASVFNDVNFTVLNHDLTGFTFDCGTNATSSEEGGGDQVISRRNLVFDVANPTIETIIPNFTSSDFSAKFVTGQHVSGDKALRFKPNNESGTIADAKFQKITLDQNIEFDFPRAVYDDAVNDTINSSGLGSSTIGSNQSIYVKCDLKTSNDYVSPVIDLQRASMCCVGECVDDGNTAINPVAETEPSGQTTGARHITTPVTTEIPAVGIDVRTGCYLPTNSNIDVYYRTGDADTNLSQQSWNYINPQSTIPTSNGGQYQEGNWVPGGLNGALPPFTQSQLKFVMKGVNQGPRIKDIRVKYLAT